jgi:hypothetical protein
MSLSRMPAESIRTPDAIGALYLERHRIGLGSPFRLIDQLLRDEALDASMRRRLAFGMLQRTLGGQGYRTDSRALDLLWLDAGPGHLFTAVDDETGARHLATIRSAVGRERDPRVGELTVRLAYQLAAASGSMPSRAAELATSAASQERDRVLAMRDAQRLLETASHLGLDPLIQLATWREDRLFEVERPVLDPLPARAEKRAVEGLPAMEARVEALSGLADSSSMQQALDGSLTSPGEGLARRMAGIAVWRELPPEAPVMVTVASYAPLLEHGTSIPSDRTSRTRFLETARNEETLAAEFALLRSRRTTGIPEVAAAILTATVALRPYAQERAWLPEGEAPTDREIQVRYGVQTSYDRDIPATWQAYLRHVLISALDDFTRVFPAYETRGLNVRFGDSPLHERALALHDPVTRTIYFPAGSSAGVMAHELAHDLDWLAARRAYGSVVGYRTDRAVRQVTDQLAGAVRQMASALRPDTSKGRADPQTRPTEIFARNVDWFVSATLAHTGRMNGFLSAAQDPVLTGYGSAMSPEATRDGGAATLRALDDITLVTRDERAWFLSSYGAERRLTVHEAVRRVLEAPLTSVELRQPSRNAFSSSEATSALLRSIPATSGAWACLLDAFSDGSADARGIRSAMEYAADARARGVLRHWRTLLRRYAPASASPLRALDGAPWDPAIGELMLRDVRDGILWRTVGTPSRSTPSAIFSRGSDAPETCSKPAH